MPEVPGVEVTDADWTRDSAALMTVRLAVFVLEQGIPAAEEWDAADGGALAFAYRHAQVLQRRDRAGKISLSLRIHPDDLGRFENRFPKKIAIEQGIGLNS